MWRHVVKIVWNRKRANGLVALEIFLSFLVLIGVLTAGVFALVNVRQPLGFETENVWQVRMDARRSFAAGSPVPVRELLAEARALPWVAAAAATENLPYTDSSISDQVEVNGRPVPFDNAAATDGLAETMGLTLSRGRWFSPEDEAAPDAPVVVNERLARDLFGRADPIGKLLPRAEPPPGQPPRRGERIIGVLAAYRVEGEYRAPRRYAFWRHDPTNPERQGMPVLLAVRVAPRTPRSFEAELASRLHAVAPELTFTVTPMEEAKSAKDREVLLPFLVMGTLCAFLLLMVALGLTGVLWESVTRRTREIGLRRAVGASGARVAAQIVLEICAVTTFAVALGALLAGQLPLLHLTEGLPPALLAVGIAAATLGLYALASLCAAYPGWLASRVLPARALRDE